MRFVERAAADETEAKASSIVVEIECESGGEAPPSGMRGARAARVSGASAVISPAKTADVEDLTLVGLETAAGEVVVQTDVLDPASKGLGRVESPVSVFDEQRGAVRKGSGC